MVAGGSKWQMLLICYLPISVDLKMPVRGYGANTFHRRLSQGFVATHDDMTVLCVGFLWTFLHRVCEVELAATC